MFVVFFFVLVCFVLSCLIFCLFFSFLFLFCLNNDSFILFVCFRFEQAMNSKLAKVEHPMQRRVWDILSKQYLTLIEEITEFVFISFFPLFVFVLSLSNSCAFSLFVFHVTVRYLCRALFLSFVHTLLFCHLFSLTLLIFCFCFLCFALLCMRGL